MRVCERFRETKAHDGLGRPVLALGSTVACSRPLRTPAHVRHVRRSRALDMRTEPATVDGNERFCLWAALVSTVRLHARSVAVAVRLLDVGLEEGEEGGRAAAHDALLLGRDGRLDEVRVRRVVRCAAREHSEHTAAETGRTCELCGKVGGELGRLGRGGGGEVLHGADVRVLGLRRAA